MKKISLLLIVIAFLFGCATSGTDSPVFNEEDLGMAAYIFMYSKPDVAQPFSNFCGELEGVETIESLQVLLENYLRNYKEGILSQPYVQMWLLTKAKKAGITFNFEAASVLMDESQSLASIKSRLVFICNGVNAAVEQLKLEGKI